MANANIQVTRVAMRTTTGTQDITISGFGTPKAAMFRLVAATTDDTIRAEGRLSEGFYDGTNSACSAIRSDDAKATSATARNSSTAAVITLPNSAGSGTVLVATATGFITDGITINVTTATEGIAYLLEVTLINGDGVLNVTVGTQLINSTSETVTLSYRPSLIYLTGIGLNSHAAGAHNIYSSGIAIDDGGSTKQGAVLSYDKDNVSTMKSGTRYSETHIAGQYFDGTLTWETAATITATGFDLDGTQGGDYVYYIAIEFDSTVNCDIDYINSPTATGSNTLGAVSFTPDYALLLAQQAAATGNVTHVANAYVAVTSSTQYTNSYSTQSSTGTANSNSLSSSGKFVKLSTTGAVQMEADYTALVSGGVEFDFTTVFGSTKKILGLFVGNSTAQDLTPTGIASAEAFGTPVIATGSVNISPSGIASTEAFGTAVISQATFITPSGIASEEAFGTAVLTTGAVIVTPSGIASAEAFGTAVITQGFVITPTGIASAEAFGTAAITTGAVTLSPTGIASEEAFGSHTVAVAGAKEIKIDFQDEIVMATNLQSTTLYFNGSNYFTID